MSNLCLSDIAAGISYAIDAPKIESELRPYLGMSQLGHDCARYLWYYFRWAATQKHTARTERIFRRGDLEEARIISYLSATGILTVDTQLAMEDVQGHLRGHADGKVTNIPDLPSETALLEIKTMNEKAFKDITKNKLKMSKPEYFIQLMVYMHYQQEKYGLFVATNKNTEELYIEIIDYNEKVATKAIHRAIDIIHTTVPPSRLSDDPKFYKCGWCAYKAQCHEMAAFKRTCRTCEKVAIGPNGTWLCSKQENKILSTEEQLATCKEYSVLKV